ncbi:MAG TPA: hypothetical protein VFX16_01445 [Pseudonocardiaceae bacterium]|nr:hypothetical protein [Pseudonocardiaceae bacterium]
MITPGGAALSVGRRSRRFGIMPESPGLYLRLSVLENLECFAELYEVAKPTERIDSALRALARMCCRSTSRTIRWKKST